MNDEYGADKDRGHNLVRAFLKRMNDVYHADKDRI